MKKLSISLLAIVVALASAFTTKKVTSDQFWFLLQTPTIQSTFDDANQYNLLSKYQNIVSSAITPSPVEDAVAACDNAGTSIVCAVRYTKLNVSGGTASKLDQVDLNAFGAFSTEQSGIIFNE
jgi:hypothetical protein